MRLKYRIHRSRFHFHFESISLLSSVRYLSERNNIFLKRAKYIFLDEFEKKRKNIFLKRAKYFNDGRRKSQETSINNVCISLRLRS